MQNIFTVTKTGALAVLAVLGVLFSTAAARQANFTHFWQNASLSVMHPYPPGQGTWMIGTITLVAVAMVGSLFAADAWNNITFTAADVKNPSRNLPLSLALGTFIVITLYVLANVTYLRELPLLGDPHGQNAIARGIQFAKEERVGTAALEVIFGPIGAVVMAIAILISGFGCNNGLILAGARIYYAMAKDGLFFKIRRQSEPFSRSRGGAASAGNMGLGPLPFRNVRPIARFFDLCGAGFLHSDAAGLVCFALEAAEYGAALSRHRVSDFAGALHRDGRFY